MATKTEHATRRASIRVTLNNLQEDRANNELDAHQQGDALGLIATRARGEHLEMAYQINDRLYNLIDTLNDTHRYLEDHLLDCETDHKHDMSEPCMINSLGVIQDKGAELDRLIGQLHMASKMIKTVNREIKRVAANQ